MKTDLEKRTAHVTGAIRIAVCVAFLAATAALQACSGTDARDGGTRSFATQPRPHASGGYSGYTSAYNRAPAAKTRYDVVGMASWYGKPYHGRRTASGEVYNMHQLTAAHPSLPFGTHVAVTNLDNGRTVIVKINDRGPFVRGRIIDVSRTAAGQLGFLGKGLTRVGVRVIASSQS